MAAIVPAIAMTSWLSDVSCLRQPSMPGTLPDLPSLSFRFPLGHACASCSGDSSPHIRRLFFRHLVFRVACDFEEIGFNHSHPRHPLRLSCRIFERRLFISLRPGLSVRSADANLDKVTCVAIFVRRRVFRQPAILYIFMRLSNITMRGRHCATFAHINLVTTTARPATVLTLLDNSVRRRKTLRLRTTEI